jgi:maltose O-acetyltransferase
MRTEKEKMLAGELYDPADAELLTMRRRARDLCREFNHSRGAEQELRARVLRELLGASGANLHIEPPFFCDYGSHIFAGDNVYFNFDCVVLDVAEVRIGDNVLCAPKVQLYTASHPLDFALRREGLETAAPIEIGDDVWLGGGAIVCPGVKIGARSVIGAGSVVTKNIPAGVLAVGNPCRVLRELA